MVNAQRVFLKGNCHFLQDRPHSPVFLFENPPIMHFQIRKRWYKNFPRDLVGAPGGGTWSQHIRPAWVPPAPAGCPPVYPPHKPGTHHTHSLTQSYIHTERHHKNPKDKSFGKKRKEISTGITEKRLGKSQPIFAAFRWIADETQKSEAFLWWNNRFSD